MKAVPQTDGTNIENAMETQQILEFAGNHPYLTGGFVAVLLFLLFTEIKRKYQGFKELTPAQAVSMINRENAVVVDVSAQSDFNKGHIVDALHISPSQLDGSDANLKKLKGKPVLVVCKSGQTAGAAASRLLKQGASQVAVLKGGMTQWINDKFPVTSK
jgi:rhodanese-related sulfurtransferase